MAAITTDDLYIAYLAYFGRPPDPTGFVLFGGLTEAAVVDAFSGSQESIDLLAGTNTLEQVNNIYRNLFNRDAEPGGLVYWSEKINLGEITLAELAMVIARSAGGEDVDTLNAKLDASVAFYTALDTTAEIIGYQGNDAAAAARAFLAGVGPQTFDADGNPTDGLNVPTAAEVDAAVLAATSPEVGPGGTLVLTAGADVPPAFQAGGGNDTFVATQATLQLGDNLRGGEGDDLLTVSISGGGIELNGFRTNSIETIQVKSLSTTASTLDMSDADTTGLTVESYETEGASLTFRDIQSINDVKFSVIDTNEAHVFSYDTENSAVNNDVARISVAEMRGSGNFLATVESDTTASIELKNNDRQSYVDEIRLTSGTRTDQATKPTMNVFNLAAGEDLDRLYIDGETDLEIVRPLDANVRLVDASAHTNGTVDGRFDLVLDLSNSADGVPLNNEDAFWTDDANGDGIRDDRREGFVAEVTVRGSQGDNHIDFGTTNNNKIVDFNGGAGAPALDSALFVGNDWLRTGTGEASVNAGNGNDTVQTGALNDIVIGGAGNDVITDEGSTAANSTATGANGLYKPAYSLSGNHFDLGADNDRLTVRNNSNNTVDAGAGNDVVSVAGSAVDLYTNDQTFTTVVNQYTLGTGNDIITIGNVGRDGEWNGSFGDNVVYGDDSSTVGGNDTISIYRDGDQTVFAGAGNDIVQIRQNANEEESVWDLDDNDNNRGINGNDGQVQDGNHYVDLGADDDVLLITGMSNIDEVTTIIAGTGNDSVRIDQDHQLNADLGTGADTIQLRAEDLQSDDRINGGNSGGVGDVMTLTNTNGLENAGFVRFSETAGTVGFETYRLLDNNITLELTDDMIETAEGQRLTVDTTGASSKTQPVVLTSGAVQGMTYADWVIAGRPYAQETYNVLAQPTTDNPTDPVFFVLQTEFAKQTVDMRNITSPDNSFTLKGGSLRDVVIGNEATINGRSILDFDSSGDAGEGWSKQDTLVVYDSAEIRTADLRNVTNLERIELRSTDNTRSTWEIELNDRVINQTTGLQELNIWVDPNVAAGSKVYVTFNENQVLAADTNVIVHRNANVQVYVNNVLVTEPQYGTKVADFDGTPGGVGLYVKTQLLFTENSDNLRGDFAQRSVFYADSLDQVQTGDTADGDFESETFRQSDENDGSNRNAWDTVQLNFAIANQDASIAEQLQHVSLWDMEQLVFATENNVKVRGFEGNSVVYAGLHAAFMPADLREIVTGDGDDTLRCINRNNLEFKLNAGNDLLTFDNVLYGDISVSGITATVDGGLENATIQDGTQNLVGNADTVMGSQGSDRLFLTDVEVVIGDGPCGTSGSERTCGDDSVHLNDVVNAITVDLNGCNDSLSLRDDSVAAIAGAITVTAYNTEHILGGDGKDRITAYINQNSDRGNGATMNIYGDFTETGANDNDTISAWGTAQTTINVWGQSGDDLIGVDTVNASLPNFYNGAFYNYGVSDSVYANGGTGNDTINVGTASPATVTVYGDDSTGARGEDVINVAARERASVYGDHSDTVLAGANDTINVKVGSIGTWDTAGGGHWTGDTVTVVDGDAYVYGGGGNDKITVSVSDDATVWGGDGADEITVWSDNDISNTDTVQGTSAGSYIYGDGNGVLANQVATPFFAIGSGADTITTHGDAAYTIQAGQGNDTIKLAGFAGDWNNNNVLDQGESAPAGTNFGDNFAGGFDRIVFENVAYNAGQQVINQNGVDEIVNFNFEGFTAFGDPFPAPEDVLDFSKFLGGRDAGGTILAPRFVQQTDYTPFAGGNGTAFAVEYLNWLSGPTTSTMDNGLFIRDADIAVIEAQNGFVLTASMFSQQGGAVANTLQIDNNGRAVVIIAQDSDASGGYDTFDVYFVQDIDSDAGSRWAVDQVATIHSLTEVGTLNASIGANTFA